jgi:hypothetical protein
MRPNSPYQDILATEGPEITEKGKTDEREATSFGPEL